MPELKDIVYILKPEMDSEELRYSLRSVEKNFPHRKVWFVGGQPKGFEPDGRILHKQTGSSKWELIRSSMYEAISCAGITEDFFLFNDDFFVMKPFKGEFVNYVDGTMNSRIEELRQKNPWLNPYGRTLYKAEQELITLNCPLPIMNYDVHLPMLFNKTLAAEAIGKCSSPQMRSVYGNVTRSPFIERPDVKVYDLETVPKSPDFLSTNDDTFSKGKVGEYIRKKFTKSSRFEVNS